MEQTGAETCQKRKTLNAALEDGPGKTTCTKEQPCRRAARIPVWKSHWVSQLDCHSEHANLGMQPLETNSFSTMSAPHSKLTSPPWGPMSASILTHPDKFLNSSSPIRAPPPSVNAHGRILVVGRMQLWVQSRLCPLLAYWPLSFSFFIYKVGIIIIALISKIYYEKAT